MDMPAKRRAVFLRSLAQTGRVDVSAKMAGFTRPTALYAYRKEHPDFAEEWDAALNIAADMVLEAEAVRRAVEGVDKDVYYKGEVVGQERVYSDGLLSKLLEGAKPEKFQKKSIEHKGMIEHTGRIGVAVIPMRAPSVEDWETEAAASEQRFIDITPPKEALPPPTAEKAPVSSTKMVIKV